MSARSMIRSHRRELERAGRRGKRVAIATGATLGAGAAIASAASAAEIPVTNTNDSGSGSLRQAIIDANANATTADVINFGPAATGTINLASDLNPITGPVDIQGPGPETLNVNGQGTRRIFQITSIPTPGVQVRIAGIQASAGQGLDGAGVHNAFNSKADLTLEDMKIVGNNAVNGGGGISVQGDGTLTIIDSTISGNKAPLGGGLQVDSTATAAVPTKVTITGSRFSGNQALGGLNEGGAAQFKALKGDVVIDHSTITGNSASFNGAGLEFTGGTGSAVSISDSALYNNQGSYNGGALEFVRPSEAVSITNSTISGNTAKDGAGVYVYNQFFVPFTIANSTIADNTATERGGGINHYGASPEPGKVDRVDLSSTIVAGNSAPAGPDLNDSGGPGNFRADHSLIGDTTGAALGEIPPSMNQLNVDPLLGPIGDNGGPTLTMLPALNSPALDAGVSNDLETDQRGEPRTIDYGPAPDATGSDGTDIGAVEIPDTEITGGTIGASVLKNRKSVVIEVRGGATGEPITLKGSGTITIKRKTYRLKTKSKSVPTNKIKKLKLKPQTKSATKKILKKPKKAQVNLKVSLTDGAGNNFTVKPVLPLRGR